MRFQACLLLLCALASTGVHADDPAAMPAGTQEEIDTAAGTFYLWALNVYDGGLPSPDELALGEALISNDLVAQLRDAWENEQRCIEQTRLLNEAIEQPTDPEAAPTILKPPLWESHAFSVMHETPDEVIFEDIHSGEPTTVELRLLYEQSDDREGNPRPTHVGLAALEMIREDGALRVNDFITRDADHGDRRLRQALETYLRETHCP